MVTAAAEMGQAVETVRLEIDYPAAGEGRLVTFFRGLMVIPHYVCLIFVGLGALFAMIGGWFGVLFTGRYPAGLFNYIVGVARWGIRVQAYYLLTTDRYPPFSLADDPSYPVRLNVAYPEHVGRWRCIPGITYLMVIPVAIGLYIMFVGAMICAIITWFSILFTRRVPEGPFQVIDGTLRWMVKIQLYVLLINTKYPMSPSA